VTRLKESHEAFLNNLIPTLSSQQLAMNFVDERVVYYLRGIVPVIQAKPGKSTAAYTSVLSKGPANPEPSMYHYNSRDTGFVSDSIYLWNSVQKPANTEKLDLILGGNTAVSTSQVYNFTDAAITAYVHRASTIMAANVILQADVSMAQYVAGLQRLADTIARQQAGLKVLVLDYVPPADNLVGQWRSLYQAKILEEFLQTADFDLVIDNSKPGIVTHAMVSPVMIRQDQALCYLDLQRTDDILIVNLTDCDKQPAGAYVYRRTFSSNGISLVTK
jgi:hypothetical protein